MTKIKICGITSAREAEWLLEEKVDFAGMVLFFPKSRRNLVPEQAEEVIRVLGGDLCKVAVVVSPTLEQIREIEGLSFDLVQIHGQLGDGVLKELHIPFLRAFQAGRLQEYESCRNAERCAGFVFDAQTPGSGRCFDWSLFPQCRELNKTFFLAGGLHPGNVAEAVRRVHPGAVDVSSGVERDSGGGKDRDKIHAFVEAVRRADAEIN